jgi:hypothetical protein
MASRPLDDSGRGFTTFGWQAINLTVPTDWELVATHGSERAGYVRLADVAGPRLEARWETATKGTDVQQVVDSYLSRVQRSLGRRAVDVSVHRGLRLASPAGKDVECYEWTGDRRVLAMLSWCETCRRTVHMQILGAPHERLRRLARTVFSSLRDHPEAGQAVWKFYDVRFAVPGAMALRRHSLQAGCVRMLFTGKGARLEFVRLSLAETLLRGLSMAEWFRRFYGGPAASRAVRLSQQAVHGHPGLMAEGGARFLAQARSWLGGRTEFRAACWHCEPTNRLMVCGLRSRRSGVGTFASILAEFQCCEGH